MNVPLGDSLISLRDISKTSETGWVCPCCRRVYAPFITRCSHCTERVEKFERLNQLNKNGNDIPATANCVFTDEDLHSPKCGKCGTLNKPPQRSCLGCGYIFED